MANSTDTKFFTNEQGHTLLDRFLKILKDTKYFDVLVGYFRSNGFYQLYEAIENVEKTRILVGISTDNESYEIISEYSNQTKLDFESHANIKKEYSLNLIKEIENSKENDRNLETGVLKFIEFLKTDCPDKEKDIQYKGNGKKLEIRAYPTKNIHAKVYISRYNEDDKEYGSVITGSSNFSYSGLVGNREFNVQLKDKSDVDFALKQFEELWAESVDISKDFVETITQKTWINDKITPYELYLKLIYEYLQEDINLEENYEAVLPEGFMKLEYQEQAVRQALKKIDEYNGVFIADVVGLGKTFITAQILQQLKGKTLIICPPVLKEYWEKSITDFLVPAKVESLGKLEHILRKGAEQWEYIVVDEAHRFRNDNTQSYADLQDICSGKKVILVTATPLNNTIIDIFSQLKLFQTPKKSTIPGIINLENYFRNLRKKLDSSKVKMLSPDNNYDIDEHKEVIKEVSKDIRDKVLSHVMIRRTRNDVVTYFKNDIFKQGLTFPEVGAPERLIYTFEKKTEVVFNDTIELLKSFSYSRYIPIFYYKGAKLPTEFEKQQQKNIGGFMKSILVKRLESSFFAFKNSVKRFIISYEKFIEMYNQGVVYISKKVNVYDLLENDDFDKLEKAVEDDKVQEYYSKDFVYTFIDDLNKDLNILKQIQSLWKDINEDPKIDVLINELKKNKILKNKHLIIFSESKETGDYLYDNLFKVFGKQVMFYSSLGGRHSGEKLLSKHTISRDIIHENFDPNSKKQENDVRILIATDVLAEGINLHRSNIIINYDLPWNPTRVLQRVGRINRLGTAFQTIHIFNFFPTTQSEKHLGLENNITNKIQMFHDILGEDAKYLTDGEVATSKELFETLNDKNAYTGEDTEGDSELKYLELMRNIRDKNPDLFEHIKKLPKKANSCKEDNNLGNDTLLTFFRYGKLKKFYQCSDNISNEINFFDLVKLLEAEPDTPKANMPKEKYYEMLAVNRLKFESDTALIEDDVKITRGASNINYIEKRLKDPTFRLYKGFTDNDEEYITNIRTMLKLGTIPKQSAKKIKAELEKEDNPLKIIGILKRHIRSIKESQNDTKKTNVKEVILSGYLKK
jgi:superfamily II DNA or RNA helicase